MNVLQVVIDLLLSCFQFVYDFYSKQFMLTDTISAWHFIMICFVVGGLGALIARAFGASSIASSGSSTVDSYGRAHDRKYKDSYEYYAKQRDRNETYKQRYNSEH